MVLALVAAAEAGAGDEVPVGAVLRDSRGRYLAQEGNAPRAGEDPLGHAEMRVLAKAGNRLGTYRLTGASLTVTLDPCPMCLGAAAWARLGAIDSAAHRDKPNPSPPPVLQPPGPWSQASEKLLRFFFESRRQG